MFRLAAMSFVIFSVFVGRARPLELKDRNNSSTISVAMNAKNESHNLSNKTSSKIVETVVEPTEKPKKEESIETQTTPLLKHSSLSDETALPHVKKELEKERHLYNSTREEYDMLKCKVSPHDDDDIIENETRSNTTGSTTPTTISSNSSFINNTGSLPTKDDLAPLNQTQYNATAKEEHRESAGRDSKIDLDHTQVQINTLAPLLVDHIRSKEYENSNGKSTDQKNNKSMPSGIIALVTALSFAMAIVVAYVGMIVWRRYIEYRYGHRELLVNELEFDTNDLRHFEL